MNIEESKKINNLDYLDKFLTKKDTNISSNMKDKTDNINNCNYSKNSKNISKSIDVNKGIASLSTSNHKKISKFKDDNSKFILQVKKEIKKMEKKKEYIDSCNKEQSLVSLIRSQMSKSKGKNKIRNNKNNQLNTKNSKINNQNDKNNVFERLFLNKNRETVMTDCSSINNNIITTASNNKNTIPESSTKTKPKSTKKRIKLNITNAYSSNNNTNTSRKVKRKLNLKNEIVNDITKTNRSNRTNKTINAKTENTIIDNQKYKLNSISDHGSPLSTPRIITKKIKNNNNLKIPYNKNNGKNRITGLSLITDINSNNSKSKIDSPGKVNYKFKYNKNMCLTSNKKELHEENNKNNLVNVCDQGKSKDKDNNKDNKDNVKECEKENKISNQGNNLKDDAYFIKNKYKNLVNYFVKKNSNIGN